VYTGVMKYGASGCPFRTVPIISPTAASLERDRDPNAGCTAPKYTAHRARRCA
jgi:hypothetical protein